MHGKTKSFFEDMSIIIVFLASIYGIYYVYVNYYEKNEIIKNTATTKTIVKTDKLEIEATENVEENITKVSSEILNKKIIIKDEPLKEEVIIQEQVKIEPAIIEPKQEEISSNTVEPKKDEILPIIQKNEIFIKEDEIVKIEKKVDLKLLRSFLIETQYDIRKNIIYPVDTNETKLNRFLKFKVTILEDGNYEQLIYVDGNKELFEMNKENILKVFPLTIHENISADFPRYLRIKIK